MEGMIRPAQQQDFPHILQLVRAVAAAGEAFPWKGFTSNAWGEEVVVDDSWLPESGQGRETFVCEVGSVAGIAGVYVMQPNGMGRCSHIAQAAFVVAPELRGHGLGKQLCRHALKEAKRRRYVGMQFDTVASTNTAAVQAWSSCGFKIMCTLPLVFQHVQAGLVDAFLMFHDLADVEVTVERGESHDVQNWWSPRKTGSKAKQIPGRNSLRPTSERAQGTNSAPCVSFSVGEEVHVALPPTPAFQVHPPLPVGMYLCSTTGAILGSPSGACPETTYRIIAGEATFQVVPEARQFEASMAINEAFAAQLENIEHPEDMPKEPLRTRAYGDWMIWMVHRAWLNDPALTDLNFTNMHMPLPHDEPRIAPKLMQAMEKNTHIEVLSLSNANVQKSQGLELADALRVNCTVSTINLESNCLDSNAVREMALSIKENTSTRIEHLRFSHQRQMGHLFFGRPAEEAVGMMMQRNNTVVKLGFECDDAHWRNEIDRALVRNNDRLRRLMQGASVAEESDAPFEEKTLAQITLQELPPPTVVASEFFNASDQHNLLRAYMAQNLQLPSWSQLQHYAKNGGAVISYTAAAPLIKECRAWLLNCGKAKEALVVDAFGMGTEGTLMAWQEVNDRWNVDVCTCSGTRFNFKADKEPAVFLSSGWAEWLRKRKSRGGA
jgi:GNAT superfamily N-acetyltransferase